jgi:hypothetical protein
MIANLIASMTGAGGGVATDYESIASASGTGSSGTITFSSIPSTYQQLQVRVFGFQTSSNDIFLKLNSNAGVRKHRLTGNGAAASAAAETGTASGQYLGNLGWNASNPTVGIVDILDANNTNKYKTVRNLGGCDQNGSGTIYLESYLFDDLTAVSSITISSPSNFNTTTRLALYGIK